MMRKKTLGNYICIYTTYNEHEAEVIRIGLEGQGVKVFFQKKGDVESVNSLIHGVEVFVSRYDEAKALRFLKEKTGHRPL